MPTIATIGYEQTSITGFIDTLLKAGVQQVIDVRELPLSRKAGFSKNGLAAALASANIDYVHLKALGDPKPGREAARAGRYAEFRKIFGRHLRTPEAKAGLQLAANLALHKHSALLCFEREHSVCHRTIVAEALRLGYGFVVHHLNNGPPRSLCFDDTKRKSRCTC